MAAVLAVAAVRAWEAGAGLDEAMAALADRLGRAMVEAAP